MDGEAWPSTESGPIVKYVGSLMMVCDGERKQVSKLLISHWREKLLSRLKVPVPQTDTGR